MSSSAPSQVSGRRTRHVSRPASAARSAVARSWSEARRRCARGAAAARRARRRRRCPRAALATPCSSSAATSAVGMGRDVDVHRRQREVVLAPAVVQRVVAACTRSRARGGAAPSYAVASVPPTSIQSSARIASAERMSSPPDGVRNVPGAAACSGWRVGNAAAALRSVSTRAPRRSARRDARLPLGLAAARPAGEDHRPLGARRGSRRPPRRRRARARAAPAARWRARSGSARPGASSASCSAASRHT